MPLVNVLASAVRLLAIKKTRSSSVLIATVVQDLLDNVHNNAQTWTDKA